MANQGKGLADSPLGGNSYAASKSILGVGNPANITMETMPSGTPMPLVGASMTDQAKKMITQWARGAKNIPYAASMIGMMSGDAGADIGEARRMAGTSPMDEYVPPAYKAEHPEWGAKQEERMQEYNTRVGKELAGVTGLDVPYDPMSGGREQREIQGRGITDEQARNRQAWLEAKQKFDEMMKRLLGRG